MQTCAASTTFSGTWLDVWVCIPSEAGENYVVMHGLSSDSDEDIVTALESHVSLSHRIAVREGTDQIANQQPKDHITNGAQVPKNIRMMRLFQAND